MLREKIYLGPVLAFTILILPPSLKAGVIEQVLVVVDGEPYTLSNLKEFAKIRMGGEFPKGDLSRVDQEEKEVLEQFITEKLLESEVRSTGIKIGEEEVDQYIDQIKRRNRLSDEELRQGLTRNGITLEKYRASIRSEIEKSEIINRQVRNKVNITADDVERYYRLNPKKFTTEEKIRLRHILLSLPAGASHELGNELMRKAVEIRNRAISGEDFAKLAEQYSEGAGAREGGDIGWISRGSLLKEIEQTVFDRLSVGQVSEPVPTSLGFHLIKLESRDAGRVLPLSEVQGRIKEELQTKALEERFQKWLKTDLRRKHRVDVKLAGVVFRPEETKEGTLDSLVASTPRKSKNEEGGFLSYLNPLSYIGTETPVEGEQAEGKLSGQNILSIFGIPMFRTESADDMPEDPLTPMEGTDNPPKKSEESPGFFSSIWKALKPF